MSQPRVHRYSDEQTLTRSVAGNLVKRIVQLLDTKQKVHLGLSGGDTANQVYQALGELARTTRLDSRRLELWWVCERYVPSGDPRRNSTQALSQLASSLSIVASQTHAMPAPTATSTPHQAALSYAQELGDTRFDICLLNMAPDGHIADLYPGSAGLTEQTARVIGVLDAPNKPRERITCTLQTINESSEVWVLASGYGKSESVLAGLSGTEIPAALVRGQNRTHWLVDDRAASLLPYHECRL